METEPRRLLSFLVDHGYEIPWLIEDLKEHCISLRIDRAGATVAYVWASWADDGVLDFHACSSRRLWLSKDLMMRLFVVAELFGAHTLQVTPVGDNATAVRRLLTRHGFEGHETLTIRVPDGQTIQPQNPQVAAPAAAPAAPAS